MISDHDITEAMIRYGGSFYSSLGRLWRQADTINQARLQTTFAKEWAEYRDIAALMQARQASHHEG